MADLAAPWRDDGIDVHERRASVRTPGAEREGMERPLPVVPEPGQESVWDYPRPPRLEWSDRHLRVESAGVVVAESLGGYRVLETSHPPTYYLAPDACDESRFSVGDGRSFCEWKGVARYWTVTVDDHVVEDACWCYPGPTGSFAAIADHRAFYPSRFRCFVDDRIVVPQPGGFYGGWITDDVVGPFKGGPGTAGW